MSFRISSCCKCSYTQCPTLTIPDATECNSLKKVMDVVALCISVLAVLSVWFCCILNWTELFCIAVNPCYILLHMALLTGYECCLSSCMLHSQHAQCNKITCCTLLHKACYWWPFSKVDLYIQFYIQQDPYVDLVASGKLHTVISVVYCCIVHGTPW